MRCVVWGIGANVESAIQVLGIETIDAFVESNPKYIGTNFREKPVLQYEDYKKKFPTNLLVITFDGTKEVIEKLNKDKLNRYVLLDEIIY